MDDWIDYDRLSDSTYYIAQKNRKWAELIIIQANNFARSQQLLATPAPLRQFGLHEPQKRTLKIRKALCSKENRGFYSLSVRKLYEGAQWA